MPMPLSLERKIKYRTCSKCGSDKTYIRKSGYKTWHKDDKDNYLCNKCWQKDWNKKHDPIKNARRITFMGKRIYVNRNARSHKCEKCNKSVGDVYINNKGQLAIIKRTNIHHTKYDSNNVLKHTQELCNSCHGKISTDKQWH